MTKKIIFLFAILIFCIVLINVGVIEARNAGSRKSSSSHNRKRGCSNVNASHLYEPLIEDEGKELQLLHIVHRHGSRTPADTYPNDPYVNHTFEPFGWGQVTNLGKCRLYDTGKWLRARYAKYLGDYKPESVYAQATGVSRTHVSLATLLAGLFRPKGTPLEWNKLLDWQPIPIYSQTLDEDTLLLVRVNCPRYYEALNEVYERPEIKSKIAEADEMMKDLTKITGLPIKTAEDVSSLHSTLKAEAEFGLELPEWTKDYYPEKTQELTDLSYIWNVYTSELKRIKGGPFLMKMSDEWKDKRDNKLEKGKKLYIYTGHDSTIVNILAALDIWKQQFPDYSIMAIFELYKDTATNQYEVKIYQKNEGKEPIPLILPGCKESCPLDKVLELIEPLTTSKALSKECAAHDPNATTPKPTGP